MLPPLLLRTSLEALTAISLAGALLLRVLHRDLWKLRFTKIACAATVSVLLATHAAWAVGLRHYPTSYWGAAGASTGMVLVSLLVLSLPVSAAMRHALGVFLRAPPPAMPSASAPPALGRRALLHGATALAPAAALGLGLRGFASASETGLPTLPLLLPRLHPDLEGFTILQLSDLHLGMTKNIYDLERLLARVDGGARRPDLIVFTGDVAEDLEELAPALALASSFGARHGVLACLGNHEYLRGIGRSRPIYEKSKVPLLVDRGTELRVGKARLHVGGANDPVVTHADIRGAMRSSVEAAMREGHTADFRILLSHRPEGFGHAARTGVDLTLSGHTHGGQIGFNGKSAFEPLWPDGYLWGGYRRGASCLYTTSGFGDWFPFRLGCPAEAPLLVLSAAPSTQSVPRPA